MKKLIKCSYFNPLNLNHGGPRLSYEPSFSDRKIKHAREWDKNNL